MSARLEIAAFGYHEVTDEPHTSGFQRPGAMPYKHSQLTFGQHLAHFAASPAGAPRAVTALGDDATGRHLLLTFDDGGQSALHAGEELSRRGWVGHFFIVTDRIGTCGFLSRHEVHELKAMGHVIGSHSHTHPNIFREQSLEQMLTEWRTSIDILADLLGEPVLTAAVPGGHISGTVTRSASLAGLRYLFTCEPTLTPWWDGDCRILGRYLVKVNTPTLRVRQLAEFRGWRSAHAMRLMKNTVRRSFPAVYRAYVARSTRERSLAP
ncbi:MAG: polysaccharide deacetylase family protein [Gemmatimonadetes bacterium]|nr:polysaccharide deacetylase family protein [Gemmatimonadota bacterium]